jgi:circadian clock protein KaiB
LRLPGSAIAFSFALNFPRSAVNKYLLKLYVTGSSARSEAAIENLHRICKDELNDCYELEVIDVIKRPDLAEKDRILATPTLVKQLPPPLRRVIGDLSDKDKVLLGLEVREKPSDSGNDRSEAR